MPATTDTRMASREPTDPWTEFDRFFDDLRGRLYGSLGFVPFGFSPGAPDPSESGATAARNFRAAPTDVTDTGKSFKILAEIPGIPKDQLQIRVRGPSVEIRGESGTSSEKTEDGWVHRERTHAGFYRYVDLPAPVVASEAKATVKDGVLELELPKQTPTPDEVTVPVQ